MVQEGMAAWARKLRWRNVETILGRKCFYYGCFILSPLMKGQADTTHIAMRRVLLGGNRGTCTTSAIFQNVPHEIL